MISSSFELKFLLGLLRGTLDESLNDSVDIFSSVLLDNVWGNSKWFPTQLLCHQSLKEQATKFYLNSIKDFYCFQ